MFLAGSGVRTPSGSWSYCMKTRFQYSRKRSLSPPGRSSSVPKLEPAVVVELRARAARAGRARLPEVLRARQQHDPLARHADRQPRLDRLLVGAEAELVVALEDRDPDPLGVEAEVLERELPRHLDGALLEVVADREVAEHLEEGEVALGEADLVDVGRAEALLAGGQPVVGRRARGR